MPKEPIPTNDENGFSIPQMISFHLRSGAPSVSVNYAVGAFPVVVPKITLLHGEDSGFIFHRLLADHAVSCREDCSIERSSSRDDTRNTSSFPAEGIISPEMFSIEGIISEVIFFESTDES